MIDITKPLEVVYQNNVFPAAYLSCWHSKNGESRLVVGHCCYGYDVVSLFNPETGERITPSYSGHSRPVVLRNVAPKPVTHTHYLVWYKNVSGNIHSVTFPLKDHQQNFAENCSNLLKMETISITV